MPSRIAIVVAMEQEIRPLLRTWEHLGRPVEHARIGDRRSASISVWTCNEVALYCGGIGRVAAMRATRAAIEREQPDLIVSAGLAGALKPGVAVGTIVRPASVIDADSGERFETFRDPGAQSVLVTAASVLACKEKQQFEREYQADAVDMEAAGVAQAARKAGVPFSAIKAISDPVNFAMPPLDRFIDADGRLHLLHLIGWAAVHPSVWPRLNALRKNSRIASEALGKELAKLIVEVGER